jgi:hypothetical protein
MGPTAEPEVLQVPAGVSLGDIQANSRVTRPVRSLRVSSWSMHSGAVHKSGDDSEELLKMHIQIEALENYPISVPEVEVTAIKTRNAGLLIVKAQVSNKSPQAAQRECQGWPMLCQWRQIVAAHVQSMKSKIRGACHKMRLGAASIHKSWRPHHHLRPHHHHERPHLQHKKPHHMHKKPHHKQEKPQHGQHEKPHHGQNKKPHHGQNKKPHHGEHNKPHHGEHHHAHKAHRVVHTIARVLLTIVIPILFGVLAGMLTYLIGMFVGTGIAMIWHAVRGRRQRYSRIQLEESDDEQEVLIYSKEGFVEEADVPPHYVEIEGSEVRQQ